MQLPLALVQAAGLKVVELRLEDVAQFRVVGVATTDAFRAVNVLDRERLLGDLHDDRGQLVDADHALGAEVQRLVVIGVHQPVDALDAVVDVAERPRLLAVAPHLDRRAVIRERHLPAQRRRRLLAPAVVGAARPVDVVEPHDPRLERELRRVVPAQQLAEQLLPAVGILRGRRERVLLAEPGDVRAKLQVLGIDARRRREQHAPHALLLRRVDRVEVDQRVVAKDRRVVRRDVTHAAHVGGERVDVIDALGRLETALAVTQIEKQELVGLGIRVFGRLHVDTPNPVAALFERADEVVADETAGARHKCAKFVFHGPTLLLIARV